MKKNKPAIKLVLIDGEPDRARSVQAALARQGMNSEVEIGASGETPDSGQRRDSDERQRVLVVELDRLRGLLLENQKLVTTGRLAASIAHEINNPLEAVMNLLYLLAMETGLTPQGRSFLTSAQAELARVAQISKQALNFNRETRHPVRVEPCGLVEEVLSLYSRRAQEKQIEIRREYRNDRTLTALPGEIRQVVSNLVANAIEATGPGGAIRVRVRTARLWSDEGQEGLRITIADTGCGIPAEVRQRLGELFFTTKGQRGTGIGLWLSHGILQRYGGQFQLWSRTSERRHGTVFSIFLPTNMRPIVVEPSRRVVA